MGISALEEQLLLPGLGWLLPQEVKGDPRELGDTSPMPCSTRGELPGHRRLRFAGLEWFCWCRFF